MLVLSGGKKLHLGDLFPLWLHVTYNRFFLLFHNISLVAQVALFIILAGKLLTLTDLLGFQKSQSSRPVVWKSLFDQSIEVELERLNH